MEYGCEASYVIYPRTLVLYIKQGRMLSQTSPKVHLKLPGMRVNEGIPIFCHTRHLIRIRAVWLVLHRLCFPCCQGIQQAADCLGSPAEEGEVGLPGLDPRS